VKPPAAPDLDALHAEVLRLGGNPAAIRALLGERPLGEPEMIALLHRAVTPALLEGVASTPPWSERPRVLGAIVLNPKAPRILAQRLLPYLFWRDLADVAVSPRVEGGVRARAEGTLKEKVVELRLGEKITLARLAPPSVLRLLLAESDAKVLDAALLNPRLREADLVSLVQGAEAGRALLERVAGSRRWQESYAVRLALTLQPRTPLALALAQITSLTPHDLRRVADSPGIAPLIQAAAARVARKPRRS
jgi:hypothetical protein